MLSLTPLVSRLFAPAQVAPLAQAPAKAATTAAKPVSQDTLVRTVETPSDWVQVVPGKDALIVRISKGQTLASLADAFASSRGNQPAAHRKAFMAAVRETNAVQGSLIREGQLLRLPLLASDDRTMELEVAIAIQKTLDQRRRADQPVADVDLGRLRVGPGPLDTYIAHVPLTNGTGEQIFMVSDDESGEIENGWHVTPAEESDLYKDLVQHREG